MRRSGVVSLLVALMALAGASAAPARYAGDRPATSIVWQARADRQAPIGRTVSRHRPLHVASDPGPRLSRRAVTPSRYARHALFQRPPPASSR